MGGVCRWGVCSGGSVVLSDVYRWECVEGGDVGRLCGVWY